MITDKVGGSSAKPEVSKQSKEKRLKHKVSGYKSQSKRRSIAACRLLLRTLNSRMHWPMQPRERTLQGLYPFLNKKFKDFSRTFKDTFPIFHFHCCGLAETTGSRWLNFVLRDQKVYIVFTQNIKTRALGFLQFLSKTTTIFCFEQFLHPLSQAM